MDLTTATSGALPPRLLVRTKGDVLRRAVGVLGRMPLGHKAWSAAHCLLLFASCTEPCFSGVLWTAAGICLISRHRHMNAPCLLVSCLRVCAPASGRVGPQADRPHACWTRCLVLALGRAAWDQAAVQLVMPKPRKCIRHTSCLVGRDTAVLVQLKFSLGRADADWA